MATVVIVGDGPGGLSAALFLAKNEQDVTVYGTDETAMHFAHLHNYLGVPDIGGTEFQAIAKAQAQAFGAVLVEAEVTAVGVADGRFVVTTADGDSSADYLILTEGKSPELARSLGLAETDDGIEHTREYATSIDGAYVVGRAARRNRSQAIISAGAGATAALDILSRIKGKDVQDWDTPPKGD